MTLDFDAVLAELESLTAELCAADASDPGCLGPLLEARRDAISRVASGLAGSARTLTPETAARLRRAYERGAEFDEILTVTLAGSRRRLAELYRAGFHARAMAPFQAPYSDLDLQA
jgi:hypothetical protein